MASTTPQASFSLLLIRGQKGCRRHNHDLWPNTRESRGEKKEVRVVLRVLGEQNNSSSSGGSGQKKAVVPPGVDTRIHWENEDEGWIGGGSSRSSEKVKADDDHEEQYQYQYQYNHQLNADQNFSHLLNTSSSHYQFLGVSEEADLEEIKGAYRRLSKEYHPDTTSLPVKAASDKFMKLKQVYDVLSDEERRRFYDWTIAQEAASREAEKMKMRMKLEDPYIQDINNWESVPDMVDRLGGRNMDLSDQAVSALTFDLLIIVFAICCIIYVIFFKDPYY